MVATRRAQSSATPPATPSASRHVDISAPPGSSVKMNKELRRLAIDANPKLGGTESPSSSTSGQERVSRRQSRQPQAEQQPEGATQATTAPALFTPSPSNSSNSPHPGQANHKDDTLLPSLPVMQQTSASSNSQQPTASVEQPPLLSNKRKITQYFSAMPSQLGNKRRKLDEDPPSLPKSATTVPGQSLASPPPVPTATSVPELLARPVDDVDMATTETPVVEETAEHGIPDSIVVLDQDKEPGKSLNKKSDKLHDTDQEHDQIYVTAEEGPAKKDDIKKEEAQKDDVIDKKALKRERELKRLQIDAKPALIGTSRRKTIQPPPSERQSSTIFPPVAASSPIPTRASSPVRASSPALPLASTSARKETVETPTVDELLSTAPIPNPPILPAGTDTRILASGKVNEKWLDKWLSYVARVTGDHDTADILDAKDLKHLVQPDRRNETSEDRHARISKELNMIATWTVAKRSEQAVQSSPEQKPAPSLKLKFKARKETNGKDNEEVKPKTQEDVKLKNKPDGSKPKSKSEATKSNGKNGELKPKSNAERSKQKSQKEEPKLICKNERAQSKGNGDDAKSTPRSKLHAVRRASTTSDYPALGDVLAKDKMRETRLKSIPAEAKFKDSVEEGKPSQPAPKSKTTPKLKAKSSTEVDTREKTRTRLKIKKPKVKAAAEETTTPNTKTNIDAGASDWFTELMDTTQSVVEQD